MGDQYEKPMYELYWDESEEAAEQKRQARRPPKTPPRAPQHEGKTH